MGWAVVTSIQQTLALVGARGGGLHWKRTTWGPATGVQGARVGGHGERLAQPVCAAALDNTAGDSLGVNG